MKMKTTMLPLILILAATVFSCGKQVTPECLQAKIVRITCAGTVVQVLNNNSIGEDGWLDVIGKTSYDNVFNVSNTCRLGSDHKVGDTVYITIGKSTTEECVHCALYDAPPGVAYDVKAISNQPCSWGSSK